MAISPLALTAYQNAQTQYGEIESRVAKTLTKPHSANEGFGQTLAETIGRVNDMQNSKTDMVQAFASGQTQNVHELMINLQKASAAMQMTTAVRGKLLDAYRELIKLQF